MASLLPNSKPARFFLLISGAFALGALASYAMAPWHIRPLLFVGLSGLYVLLHHAPSARMAAMYGFVFGLGYFGFGLSWIGNALLVEGNPYRWVWPLAVIGLPLLLSPFPALACGLFKRFCISNSFRGLVAFTGFLSLSELARGHLFTGFPWNLYGYAWADLLPLVQTVSIGTVYLLTALTIFWAALPGYLFVSSNRKTVKLVITLAALGLFSGLYVWGTIRLQNNPTTYNKNFDLVIVQPNIAQSKKWEPEFMGDNFFKQIELSENTNPQGAAKATYIIWPETAIAQNYLESSRILEMIGNTLDSYSGDAHLITGALRYNREEQTYHNSIIMIDRDSRITNTYDKSHLVPFGEYIPLDNIFDIAPVVGFSGFAKGGGPVTLETPESFRYAPLICYEIIFSGGIIEQADHTPDVIINVTNDAWYGISAGPYQHFEQALYRAVEEGIPVIRSANTGFSAIIDPMGRTLVKRDLFQEGTLRANLPKKFAQRPKNIYRTEIVLLALFVCFLLSGLKKIADYTNDN